MSALYFILTGIIVVISSTMLLTKRLKPWKVLLMAAYIIFTAYTAMIWGQIIGIMTIVGVSFLAMILSEEYRIENGCFACIGYLINVTVNNLLCLAIVDILNIPLGEFEEKYWLPFCIFYSLLLLLMGKLLRYILYDKINLTRYIDNIQPPVRYGLFANMLLYGIIFFINIASGQNAGYSAAALRLNCILFIICMIVSGFLIVTAVSSMKSIEQKKAEERQRKIMENYIKTMEQVTEELRAFKHDYKNIMAEIAGFVREGRLEELKEYYSRLMQTEEIDRYKDMHVWKSLSNIQPLEVKGLLYEKVLNILGKDIEFQIRIESDLCVTYPDIRVINRILGVFIDNAVEAAAQAKERFLSIEVSQDVDAVTFQVANTCKELPDLAKIFHKGYSTKGKNRGMGLYWVQNVLRERPELAHEIDTKDNLVIQKLFVPNK